MHAARTCLTAGVPAVAVALCACGLSVACFTYTWALLGGNEFTITVGIQRGAGWAVVRMTQMSIDGGGQLSWPSDHHVLSDPEHP